MKRWGRRLGLRTTALTCLVVLGLGLDATGAAASGSSPSASSPTYTVKSGDSLSGIASRSGVSLTELLSVNGFVKTTVIVPGQVIKLPNGGRAAASGSSPSASSPTYTVKSGDSLSGIASRSGVSLTELLSVNGFVKSSVILPGQIIKLPTHARVAAPTAASGSSTTSVSGSVSTKVAKVVEFARAQVGKPYRFGSAGPDAYDCSGLVRAAFLQIGISLPHQSREQSVRGKSVDWITDVIRPGDLVFTFSSDTPNQIGHVGIAISATEWVQAPYSGGAVRVSKLPSDDRIRAVRRIVTN